MVVPQKRQVERGYPSSTLPPPFCYLSPVVWSSPLSICFTPNFGMTHVYFVRQVPLSVQSNIGACSISASAPSAELVLPLVDFYNYLENIASAGLMLLNGQPRASLGRPDGLWRNLQGFHKDLQHGYINGNAPVFHIGNSLA